MKSQESSRHVPVLTDQVLKGLDVKKGQKYIDATVGDAGLTQKILKKGGVVLALDRDPKAIKRAKKFLKSAKKVNFALGNFSNLKNLAKKKGFNEPFGILFDLGLSSAQFEAEDKGLSFNLDAPLDMRLDPSLKISAKDLVNQATKEKLYEILTRNSQEELAWPITKAIVSARCLKPIQTTGELAEIVIKSSKSQKPRAIHPASKTFLALRIEVNSEIENLKKGLKQAIELLKKGGRLVVISFHETEDRIVKQRFKKAQKQHKLKILSKKPITPSQEELIKNPRSRSAKLRIAEKL